ncbi:MAG: GTP 3',8-cyclase MoaA [Saprospiraceae bacterium]|jgi:cyclic pyranopterin phosphate synthase|nr:GTP 3',8-cyclase MoaA [Saprospiraceae bacterium]
MAKLFDNHGRQINYVRLAVTDRCNLRCFYCMPEEGIKYVARQELLTYEEMEKMMNVLVRMGVSKLRITGGEPFIRRDMMPFLWKLSKMDGLQKINITTNGTVTAPLVPDLKKMGIHSINLSLDALDADRFFEITRRNVYKKVMETFDALLSHGISTKINAVVMEGKNIEDIIPMAELTKDQPVSVRFIEEMPFNGEGNHYEKLVWNHRKILAHLKERFPDIDKMPDPPHSTSANYQVPGHKGSIGIIAAYSRTFCGSCNRIRITPQGMLKTCLYDGGVFNIRDIMRAGATEEQLKTTFLDALGNRAKDGFEAEKRRSLDLPISESMATIGG